jgi:transcriptional/translational regulatory protein YebC/TACO1
LVVYTEPKELAKVRDAINTSGLTVTEAELTYVPKNTVEISDKNTATKIMNLMDALDELDDVVATHTNFDIADGVEVD